MDKEYLSLMAELGEAPVPSSGGGHSHQGGGPRNSQQVGVLPTRVIQSLTPVSGSRCRLYGCISRDAALFEASAALAVFGGQGELTDRS